MIWYLGVCCIILFYFSCATRSFPLARQNWWRHSQLSSRRSWGWHKQVQHFTKDGASLAKRLRASSPVQKTLGQSTSRVMSRAIHQRDARRPKDMTKGAEACCAKRMLINDLTSLIYQTSGRRASAVCKLNLLLFFTNVVLV